MSFDNWIKLRERTVKNIESINVDDMDRLDLMNSLRKCWSACDGTQYGWQQWLRTTDLISKFNEEALREFLRQYQRLALEFLQFDLDTSKVAKKFFPESKRKMSPNSLHA